MSYQQLADAQVNPEIPINENNSALGQAFLFSHDVPNDTGLVVGISGGVFNGATIADGTVTCADDDENYIVAARSGGALSVAVNTTNWDDTATYGRIARVTFASGVLTAFNDERFSSGGIFDSAVSSITAGQTVTLTNKRITPRAYSTTSTATLTPETDTYDYFELTAQAANLTIANQSTTTPTAGEKMVIAITPDATPRTLAFGTAYVAKGGIALPTTTVASKTMTLGLIYNAGLAKWNLVALAQEA